MNKPVSSSNAFQIITEVMALIERYGQIEGGHHKAWVLDQIARTIKGDAYPEWVEMMKGGWDEEEESHEYYYDEGIAP